MSTQKTKWAVISALIIVIVMTFFYFNQNNQKLEPLPEMTVAEKKDRFKSILLPAINNVYQELTEQYEQVAQDIKNGNNTSKIDALMVEYKANSPQQLLAALKPHPRSIALAQAAMESSWATSRFTRQANNVFGVWSFDKDEPRIAAGEQRGDKTIWVKKYDSIEASVRDYYRVLARGAAFEEFRQLKMISNNPFELVKKLDKYSEKGALYGEELTAIIKFNKFDQYDH